MKAAEIDEVFRPYALEYFKVHAEQRLKAFNFYLLLQTALLAVFAAIAKDGNWPKWTALVALLGVFFSFVFWKLDDRTRDLIRVAEEALKHLDEDWELDRPPEGGPSPLALFAREEYLSTNLPKYTPVAALKLSYTRSFRAVFLAFAGAHMILSVVFLITGR
jgi:hypothetical protein